eukprot:1591436-Rhodomonas_salina.1
MLLDYGSVEKVGGFTVVSPGFAGGQIPWCAQVDCGKQQPSLHRPEAAALEHSATMSPLNHNVVMLVDNQSTLVTTACWVGAGSQLRPLHIANRDIMLSFLARLGRRTGWTKLAKIKSHRAEPANTIADHITDIGTTSDRIMGYGSIPIIIFRAPGGLRGAWSKQLDRHAHDSAADFLQHIEVPNVTEEWLARDGLHRAILGQWWRRKVPDGLKRLVLQSISNTYPSLHKLHQWGLRPSPDCTSCRGNDPAPLCTQGHIQSRCDGTKEARIKAHHALCKVISDAIGKRCKKWHQHPETSLGSLRTLI